MTNMIVAFLEKIHVYENPTTKKYVVGNGIKIQAQLMISRWFSWAAAVRRPGGLTAQGCPAPLVSRPLPQPSLRVSVL